MDQDGQRPPGRLKSATAKGVAVYDRGNAAYERGKGWVDAQDPATRKGATIGWYRRFRESDGGLLGVLLTAYLFVTAFPAAVVMISYVYSDATVAGDRLVNRLGLTGEPARLVHSVVAGTSGHQLGATLFAVANVFIFGIGFGRVLQIVHARAWKIDLGKPQFFDQARYLLTLLVPVGFLLLYIVQTHALHGQPSWIGWLLLPVWLVALISYFVWMPRMLLHKRVSARDVLPGAVFTILGLTALRLISALLFRNWLVWYSKYYGSLGVAMAIFFWIALPASVLVLAAAFSPALAHRRDLREAQRRAAAAVGGT
jgi:membrane protein